MALDKSSSPLPIALAMLIIGLFIGWMRYMELYGYTLISLRNLYSIHPHIMIYGFISLVILFERYRGVGVSRGYRNLLLIGIITNILAIFLLIADNMLLTYTFRVGYYLLVIPPVTYIIFLFLNRGYIYNPVFTLHLTSKLFFIMSILADIMWASLDRYVYSLLLLSYPTLFILGERLELTRFIAPKKWIEYMVYLNSILYLAIFILIFIFGRYMNYLGYISGFPLVAIILMIISLDPTLKIRRPMDTRMKYLSFHLKIGYIMLLLGILAYYFGRLGFPQVNLYDAYVHLVALGFIGMMLLGHGPIILSSLLGIKVRFGYGPAFLLLIAILLRVFQDLFYIYLQQLILTILSLLAGILIFTTLFTFLFNTLIYGVFPARTSHS